MPMETSLKDRVLMENKLKVSMMNSTPVEADEMVAMPLIKKEETDSKSCFQPCSPSSVATTTLYSPTTTVLPTDLKFGDEQYLEISENRPMSPASPDHQYCSSTTQSIGDSIFPHVEEGMKQDDLPRRLCLVCGDIASGFHYGVASCEACKAFFKRTIQGNIEYTCPAANDCEINKRRRKACQACRFQKCLHMGMLKEGVRLDRVRGGRQKYRRNPDMSQSMQSWPSVIKSTPSLEDNKILSALTTYEPEILLAAHESNVVNDPSLKIINILSDLYDRELVSTIGWAKQIPGFTELSLNDQMRLLQSTWAEILTLTMTFRSLNYGHGKLRFASDFVLEERQAKECGALEIYHLCIHIIDKLNKLSIAKEEYFLLKALVLANSDVRLEDASALKKFRDSILAALCDCVYVIRPNTCINHIQNLLLCLPSLRQADQYIRRFWCGVHRDGKVVMNKLFIEMLESCSPR
ncbi:steroid hormone receptor ERR1 isoform X1 [Planococcus citri]|uniref:steroid hormone receptor ERR1 isoform X1 n=2 Tax=Planococcus citri TaxID=170843 RepID=UPI0031F8170B